LGGPLANARHEQFAQLVASGKTPAAAYVSAGFSPKGAHTSAARLLHSAPLAARVAELKTAISGAAVTRAAVDRDWVLRGLKRNYARAMQLVEVKDKLGRPAGVFIYNGQVANRSLELIGKEIGMFIDRSEWLVWDGDPDKLTEGQMEKMLAFFERQRAAGGTV